LSLKSSRYSPAKAERSTRCLKSCQSKHRTKSLKSTVLTSQKYKRSRHLKWLGTVSESAFSTTSWLSARCPMLRTETRWWTALRSTNSMSSTTKRFTTCLWLTRTQQLSISARTGWKSAS
jgi:hypothetical protein